MGFAAAVLGAGFNVAAQTINTNAFDQAAGYPNQFSGVNRGFGFGPWAVTTVPSGGSWGTYISGDNPPGWGLWNSTADSATTANRPFNSPLPTNGTFSCDFRLETLDTPNNTNAMLLQDANGNVVFSYFHVGMDTTNGWYSDASGKGLVATNFSYNGDQYSHLRFTLTSATTYTFSDDTTTNSFTGTLSGAAITQVTFLRANGDPDPNPPSNGQDFKFNSLMITSPLGTPPVISLQPVNSLGFAGGTVTLNAAATSTEPINYQWYFDGGKKAGATATNLVLANVGPANAGGYYIIASNSLGSATSSVAVVAILPAGYTNAFDVAANYPSGPFAGNLGYGFGTWGISTSGGGDYISGDNPPLFGIWNNTPNASSTAMRPFDVALPVGASFLVELENTSLDSTVNTNGIELQDASGNVLFSYFHEGTDSTNGWYTDAAGTGTATGFAFDSESADLFAFTLNSSTSYTFYDITDGRSFSGTLSGGPIQQVTFVRANGTAVSESSGQDFKFNALTIVAPSGNPPIFSTEPQNNGGLVGSTIGLSALAVSSSGPETYQWYFGTTPIASATNASLTVADASLANSGSYQVVAANAFGRTTSSVAVVTAYVENQRLLAYEGFNYPASTLIDNISQDGGLGWSGAWTNVAGMGNEVVSGSPSDSLVGGANVPTGYDALSTGNYYYAQSDGRAGRWLDCSTSGAFSARGYLDGTGNIGAAGKTVYVSFMMQPDVTTMFYEFELHRADLNDPGRIAGVGDDTTTNDVYFREPSGAFVDLGVGDSFEDPSVGNHAVDFYVVRIDYQPGHADNVRVYRNPTSLTEPATATVALTNVGNMSFNGISLGAYGNYIAIDEIRLGATWSDVLGLPGPSTMMRPVKQGGSWAIQFAGNPAFTYRVQRATSLSGPWTDLGTATPLESGIGTLNDANPPSTQAFYRVVTP
jgi:hypothetical protein